MVAPIESRNDFVSSDAFPFLISWSSELISVDIFDLVSGFVIPLSISFIAPVTPRVAISADCNLSLFRFSTCVSFVATCVSFVATCVSFVATCVFSVATCVFSVATCVSSIHLISLLNCSHPLIG